VWEEHLVDYFDNSGEAFTRGDNDDLMEGSMTMTVFKNIVALLLGLPCKAILTFSGYVVTHKVLIEDDLRAARHRGAEDALWAHTRRNGPAIWAVRDIAHNLPYHLNFETREEEEFCSDVLSCVPPEVLTCREPYDEFTGGHRTHDIPKGLREKYLGKAPFHYGAALTDADFDAAAKGNIEKAVYIAKVIFCHNRPRYKKANEWWEGPQSQREENSPCPLGR